MAKYVRAVLTGDLVGSSSLSPVQQREIHNLIRRSLQTADGWSRQKLVIGKVAFFRGDSWQVLLQTPTLSLRVASFIRAKLLSHASSDTRISIGIGNVDSINHEQISLSSGEAFVLSGRSLDSMKSKLSIALPQASGEFISILEVVVGFCDLVISNFTTRQAAVFAEKILLPERTNEVICHSVRPSITAQAVSKTLRSAHWPEMSSAFEMFEALDWDKLARSR
jgi:hypothetical protein